MTGFFYKRPRADSVDLDSAEFSQEDVQAALEYLRNLKSFPPKKISEGIEICLEEDEQWINYNGLTILGHVKLKGNLVLI
jgi:hypothetical protein